MNQKPLIRNAFAGLLLALAALLSACASTGTTSAGESAANEAAAVEIEPWEGDGMEIPLDGSSLEAFEASLARVKAHSTPEEYSGLVNAIDYLLIYDVGANRNRTMLASRLDGLTPVEVMQRVKYRRAAPGRSPADKTAADAKIIDS